MDKTAVERDPSRLFAPAHVAIERRADGTVILRSPDELHPYGRCIGDWLVKWAAEKPDAPFLMERSDGTTKSPWRVVTYKEALQQVEALATWILDRNLGPGRPLVILNDNSINHALLGFAALHAGVPYSSISAAYSLVSRDFGKLKSIVALLEPGAIFVPRLAPFAAALSAIAPLHQATVIVGASEPGEALPAGMVSLEDALAKTDRQAVAAAFARVTPDTIAKFLFTSGSTGAPKGVINTQRMLCASQMARTQVWPFLTRQAPVVLDWLPWSHTFGGNHNLNMILWNGGTLAIDAGKPAPGLFQTTLDNIKSIEANICFNVPRGYDMLVAALHKDQELRERFFGNLQIIFYAAAALPQNLWNDLIALSTATIGRQVPLVSSWGSTETAPLASDCYWQAEKSGVIGLPVPGVELKLVPANAKLEIRVRGPNVTPGYWKQAEMTRKAFDPEGFYTMGDAVKFLDPDQPDKGLVFDGRVAEDFKLMSGTWVSAGAVRVRAIEAMAPVAQDIVLTGHDREELGFLIFPNVAACRQIAQLPDSAALADIIAHPEVRATVQKGLRALKAQGGGSSTFATRAILMAEPPSIDAGEITDKGYTNQLAVRSRRTALIEAIGAEVAGPDIVTL
ncbi:MAG: feruloyl-CoA synthase [Xanthobacteraceae bacterium]|nr:MAG: feruloyl-CoA synthase [Xanthobacteraceae bacterium]